MKVKCVYCGSYIDENDVKCPNCGTSNSLIVKKAYKDPKTIEELKQWYLDMNLPSESITRFFIGKNYQEPRAFGIYKDENTGNFVVYKNKDDGVRAVRYEGDNEAFAVNELYMRLKQEILHQKARNNTRKIENYRRTRRLANASAIFILAIFLVFFSFLFFRPQNGYYDFNNKHYYYLSGSWYKFYDSSKSWVRDLSVPNELKDNSSNYYSGKHNEDYKVTDFEDTTYYHEYIESRENSRDSDYSWSSSDSWDSGGTDWSSDW